jgi:hypothetical protein
MAIVNHTFDTERSFARLFTWPALSTGDIGDAMTGTALGDKTGQLSGNFNGATLIVEGSNTKDGTYHTLSDPLGNALSFTSAGLFVIFERPQFIRPRVSGGSSPAITVTIEASKVIR